MQKLPENIANGMLKTSGITVEQMSKVSSYIEQTAAFVCGGDFIANESSFSVGFRAIITDLLTVCAVLCLWL